MSVSVPLLLMFAVWTSLVPDSVSGSWCHNNSRLGDRNELPIDDSAAVFVRRVTNGERYLIGAASPYDAIHLIHVYGYSGYDFGYAFGQLMGNELNATLSYAFDKFAEVVAQQIEQGAAWIPAAIASMIATKGLDFFLDWQYDESRSFMDPEVFAEMHGMSDASGTDYLLIRRIHFFGEITRGACSLFGAHSSATRGGNRVMLRAFDWNTGVGLQNYPTITVYHPLGGEKQPLLGHAWMNIGWAGWIGSLSGVSSELLGMGSIGITNPDNTFGNQSYVGEPFIFLQRRVLQHAKSISQVEAMISCAHRTCHLVFGAAIGRKKGPQKGVSRLTAPNITSLPAATSPEPYMIAQYSASQVRFFNSSTLQPLETWHPRIPDIVYECMDWVCPSFQRKMAHQLLQYHGQLDPVVTLRNITSIVMTGNLQVVTMDLDEGVIYVANAKSNRDPRPESRERAYDRTFVFVNATQLFVHGENR